MLRKSLLLVSVTALAACGGADALTTPGSTFTPGQPRHELDDWNHYGLDQFYFLPASLGSGKTDNTFDSTLSPTVTVCLMGPTTCGATLATFTRTSGTFGRTIAVNTTSRSYTVNWPTSTTTSGSATRVSAGQVYRVSVAVGTRALGHEDVKFVSSSSQLASVDTSQYKGAVAGSTFAISFRVNQGIPGSIQLSASSISENVNDGKPLTVTLRDLHGNTMTSPWLGTEIDNDVAAPGEIAVLDSGLVVGQFTGSATFWAWIGDLEVSIPITVTDTRHAWTVQATPDDQGNRSLWGTSATNVYAANHTGVLHFNGTTWAHEAAPRWRSTYDVYGTSASDVWAVGDQGMILHWDGSAWSASRYDGTSVQPVSLTAWDVPARQITLRALWGIPGQVLATVGDQGTAMYYDGTSWNVVPTGVTSNLTDLWGSGLVDWYATTSDGKLLHYNGSVGPVAGVTAPGSMNGVWGTSATNVYVVGDGGTVYHYNGTSWSSVRLPTRSNLYAVWGTSATNLYVGGENGTLYHYDGTNWTPEKIAQGSSQVWGFWGDGGTNVFAAGAGGLIAKR